MESGRIILINTYITSIKAHKNININQITRGNTSNMELDINTTSGEKPQESYSFRVDLTEDTIQGSLCNADQKSSMVDHAVIQAMRLQLDIVQAEIDIKSLLSTIQKMHESVHPHDFDTDEEIDNISRKIEGILPEVIKLGSLRHYLTSSY